jgi:hypothetical protein
MAMFGWESSRQATVYAASADRKRLAAEAARLAASIAYIKQEIARCIIRS